MAGGDGLSITEMAELFPDEQAARKWFEGIIWPSGPRTCRHCRSPRTAVSRHPTMPYRCRDCRRYFNVMTGSLMAGSQIPLNKWVHAIYLEVTSQRGVSSMQLHRDLGITQKSAWFLQGRIREAFVAAGNVYLTLPDTNSSAARRVSRNIDLQVQQIGTEKFRQMLQDSYRGTHRRISRQDPDRLIAEFTVRQVIRERDTIEQMAIISRAMFGKQLTYKELIT